MSTPPIPVPPQTVQVNAPAPPNAGSQVPTQQPQTNTTIPTQPLQNAPQAEAPHPIKSAVSGWQALMGTHPEVQQTDGGPVTTQVQNKPGQFFRSILAGALMGAAAGGSEPTYSGWQGAARGAGAVQQQQRADLARQQALGQQQYENSLRSKQEQREETNFNNQQTLFKAQMVMNNLQKLGMIQQLHNQSLDYYKNLSDWGKANAKPYQDAGMQPVVTGVSESQHNQYIKDHPGATSLDWQPTGIKMGQDANGNPTWEATYDAYDPKGVVKVSDATYKKWKDEGVFDRFPEFGSMLKDNKQLSAQQYAQVAHAADGVYGDNLHKQLDELNVKKLQTAINADNARMAESYANIKKINAETQEAALGKTQQQAFNNALEDLNKAGGDFSKLKPSSRVVIAESMNKMVPGLTALYKQQVNDIMNPDSQQEAAQTLQQIQSLTTLGTRALSGMGGQQPGGQISVTFNGQTGVFSSQAEADAFIKAHPGATLAGQSAAPQGVPAPNMLGSELSYVTGKLVPHLGAIDAALMGGGKSSKEEP